MKTYKEKMETTRKKNNGRIPHREFLIYRNGKMVGHIQIGYGLTADKFLSEIIIGGATLKRL